MKYEIRDPVYGFITFNEWEKEIINHYAFQRLRRIRQLALTEFVYPSAIHTRFEHSLGVMHLATLMFDTIISDDKNRKILKEELGYERAGFERDRQLIRLAALLHDIGHAPFSHGSEDIMPIKKGKERYKHEDYTAKIIEEEFREVIEDNQINKTNYNISAEEVAALIKGDSKVLGNRIFWRILISSQLDADRGDYLLRDSHHIGVKYGVYDYARLLNTLTLGIDPESNDVILGVSEDGWHVAESVVIARYQMFTQVYFHRTRRAYDYHLKEAMKSIIGYLPPPNKIDKFLELDDYVILARMKESMSNYDCKAIFYRNHIRELYSTQEIPTKYEEEKIAKVKDRLNENDIWFFEDRAEKSWYDLNGNGDGRKEIMIINCENKVRPLSEYSNIVKHIGTIKQVRIYVKPEDREKAKKIIGV